MEHILPRTDHRESQEKRAMLALAGGAVLLYGMKFRSVTGGLLSLVGADLVTRGLTGHHLYEMAGLTKFTARGAGASVPYQLGIQVQRSLTVNVSADEAYQFIRNLENLPRFVSHLQSVTSRDRTHSHWMLRGPVGSDIEWDSEIVNDVPNEIIAWRSINCPDFESAGSIRFEKAPRNRGTVLRLILQYIPPGGVFTASVAKLFGKDPATEIQNDLLRLKQLLEAGEIATTEGQPSGSSRRQLKRSIRETSPVSASATAAPEYSTEQASSASSAASA